MKVSCSLDIKEAWLVAIDCSHLGQGRVQLRNIMMTVITLQVS
jgi:hypothetical protein